MDCSKYSFLQRLLLQGIIVIILLSISSIAIASYSSIVAIRICPTSSYTRVTLESNIALKYRQFVLSAPNRVVLDLENLKLNNILQEINTLINSRDPYLKLVRVGQFTKKIVRLVFEVKTHISVQMFTITPISGFKHRLIIDFYPSFTIHNSSDSILKLIENCSKDKFNNTSPIKVKKINKNKSIIIMIDPGHGGEDPGAIGKYKTQEKDIVLQIAQRLKMLINHEPKMKVYMTRNKDVFIPLKVRVAKAKKIHADLFVSIHTNAFTNRETRGSSVFALSTKEAINNTTNYLTQTQNKSNLISGISKSGDKYFDHAMFDLVQTVTINNSLKFAAEVLKWMGNVNNLHKKIVDTANFLVLKTPDIPSILIETAFISNLEEEKKLKTERFQQQLAESIFQGIKSYLITIVN